MTFVNRTGNLTDMKGRITSFMRIRGPALPIHISKETKTTLLLASAFLADLVSEKTIKISNLKVGGSPLYYLPGQEAMLENFHKFMPGKEREAFLLLKEARILKDDEQEPAIRVALRAIKDFAKPYTIKFQDQVLIFWQYFSLNEEDARKLISEKLELLPPMPQEKLIEPIVKPEIKVELKVDEKKRELVPVVEIKVEPVDAKPEIKPEIKEIEQIFEKPKKAIKREKKPAFLEEVKSYLTDKNIELIKIEKQDKKEITARIKLDGYECLLLALNKKRADDSDLVKAHKKSQQFNIPYSVLCKGEVSKKTKEAIDAFKNLKRIDKI